MRGVSAAVTAKLSVLLEDVRPEIERDEGGGVMPQTQDTSVRTEIGVEVPIERHRRAAHS
jgi:hypothetical protein